MGKSRRATCVCGDASRGFWGSALAIGNKYRTEERGPRGIETGPVLAIKLGGAPRCT